MLSLAGFIIIIISDWSNAIASVHLSRFYSSSLPSLSLMQHIIGLTMKMYSTCIINHLLITAHDS